MPISHMRTYYESAKRSYSTKSASHMHEVAEYCIIDALRCQQLLVKRNVINDNREIASIAFISLFDSHYYAGGMKVCNLLGAEAWKRDMLVSMIPGKDVESGKYPGAHVFPPIKGLNNKRPVTGLDFASLYPSIIMSYNLSPEKMVFSSEEADILKKEGKKLHEIEFPFNGRILCAWAVRHENRNNNKGLYPSVLEKLLSMRNEMKAQLANLAKKKEYMELVISNMREKGLLLSDAIDYILRSVKKEDCNDYTNILTPFLNKTDLQNKEASTSKKFIVEYEAICFNYTCLDSKQKAVKLYMNTFYGEVGNSLSPFFQRHLAGAVTSAGQFNIKLVAEYVLKKGYEIQYGDTDSLYLTCPKIIIQNATWQTIMETESQD